MVLTQTNKKTVLNFGDIPLYLTYGPNANK